MKGEIIEASGLSVTGTAQVMRVTRPVLSPLLHERARLSPGRTLRIEKAFGVSMDPLMMRRMQNGYDIARARNREGEIKVAPFEGQAA